MQMLMNQWKGKIAIIMLFGFFMIAQGILIAQTRDEETANEMEKLNPLKPAADVIDNTVNKVLPFDIPTKSKIKEDEKICFEGCRHERDYLLKKSSSEVDRGHSWAMYNKCRSDCPEKIANENSTLNPDAFHQERYPAGSAIDK